VYHRAQLLYTTQHRTVLIIFPLILQTVIIAQTIATGEEGTMSTYNGNTIQQVTKLKT